MCRMDAVAERRREADHGPADPVEQRRPRQLAPVVPRTVLRPDHLGDPLDQVRPLRAHELVQRADGTEAQAVALPRQLVLGHAVDLAGRVLEDLAQDLHGLERHVDLPHEIHRGPPVLTPVQRGRQLLVGHRPSHLVLLRHRLPAGLVHADLPVRRLERLQNVAELAVKPLQQGAAARAGLRAGCGGTPPWRCRAGSRTMNGSRDRWARNNRMLAASSSCSRRHRAATSPRAESSAPSRSA